MAALQSAPALPISVGDISAASLALAVTPTGGGSAGITLQSTSAASAATSARWHLGLTGVETGADAGSALTFAAYADNGTFLGNPIYLQRAIGGSLVVSNTPVIVDVASTTAFVVGTNSVNNPQFEVDTSAVTVATGIRITGAAAGGGVSLAAMSSGAAEDLNVIAKGAGAVRIGASGTGIVAIGNTGGAGTFISSPIPPATGFASTLGLGYAIPTTAGAAGGQFTLGKNTGAPVTIATYMKVYVGTNAYWIPLIAVDPSTA